MSTNIPPDVLREIYSWLPIRDIIRSSQICRQFCNCIIMNRQFWMNLAQKSNIPTNLDTARIQKVLFAREIHPRTYNLDVIHISNPTADKIIPFEYIAFRFPEYAEGCSMRPIPLRLILEDLIRQHAYQKRPNDIASSSVYRQRLEQIASQLKEHDLIYLENRYRRVIWCSSGLPMQNKVRKELYIQDVNLRWCGGGIINPSMLDVLYAHNAYEPLTIESISEFYGAYGPQFTAASLGPDDFYYLAQKGEDSSVVVHNGIRISVEFSRMEEFD